MTTTSPQGLRPNALSFGDPAFEISTWSAPQSLQAWVQSLSTVDHAMPFDRFLLSRAMPEGSAQIAFVEWESETGVRHGIVGRGATGGLMDIPSHGARFACVVRAQPGAARWLLGVDPRDVVGEVIDLQQLWGAGAAKLCDDLAAAPNRQRPWLLTQFLSRRREPPSSTVALALHLSGNLARVRITTLARDLGMTERTLHRHFLRDVGLTPKAFLRTERVAKVVRHLVNHGPSVDYLRLAQALGYSDQSHLLREFRKQLGLSPRQLLNRSLSHAALNSCWFLEDPQVHGVGTHAPLQAERVASNGVNSTRS